MTPINEEIQTVVTAPSPGDVPQGPAGQNTNVPMTPINEASEPGVSTALPANSLRCPTPDLPTTPVMAVAEPGDAAIPQPEEEIQPGDAVPQQPAKGAGVEYETRTGEASPPPRAGAAPDLIVPQAPTTGDSSVEQHPTPAHLGDSSLVLRAGGSADKPTSLSAQKVEKVELVIKEEISPGKGREKEEDIPVPVVTPKPVADTGPPRRRFLCFVRRIVRPSAQFDPRPESIWDVDEDEVIDLVSGED